MKIFKNKKAEEDLKFKAYLIAFLLTALFIVSIYNFATGIGNQYNKSMSIEDKKINISGLSHEVNKSSSEALARERSMADDQPEFGTGVLLIRSIWGIGKLMWSSGNTILSLFFEAAYNLIGIPESVLGVILAILSIGVVFAIWRLIKVGE